MSQYRLTHLDELEAESIHVLRETVAQFENICLLFSGGKDSICLARLAEKAFRPAAFPFFFLHIDTGHNFQETLDYRDRYIRELGGRLEVRLVQDTIDQGKAVESTGPNPSRNVIQSVTLLDAFQDLNLDCAIGGARRDEEKARAKERFFSHRDEFGQWNPQNQRPELWNLYNGRKKKGEHFRVFPLSNWTELDVWKYIEKEEIPLPSLYFSHSRRVIKKKSGTLLAEAPCTQVLAGEKVCEMTVRCRTIGDITCTGLVESHAKDVADIIQEISQARTTERGGREDDKVSESAMEDRKREGYF